MRDLLPESHPILALAPMQDITDLPFMRMIGKYGGPDYYVTEYFRVYENSPIDKYILRSIVENSTGKPIFAQMIGKDIKWLVKTAKQLMEYDVAGIDINLGCPAPVVCRKDAGGGLLRNLNTLHSILAALREAVDGRFTVKTRVGYESHDEFQSLLEVFKNVNIDALAIHGRTVKERYQTPVHTDKVKLAVEQMSCPVIANGNVVNAATGLEYLNRTGAAGLMIGRGAIRSPWIFEQLRQGFRGEKMRGITRNDLKQYVSLLFDEVASEWTVYDEVKHVNKMKKYMAYIAQGIDAEFEFRIRRSKSKADFFQICEELLTSDELIPDLPPENSKLFCGFSDLLK